MIIEQAPRIHGTVSVPGDKSIAHRALIFGALARGRHEVTGLPNSADIRSTIDCLRTLGILIEEMPDGRVLVIARTPTGGHTLDAGNSGTTARLLAGYLAGQRVTNTLQGDDSLRRRPMERVADPLSLMGADIETTDECLPMTITGGGLHGISYALPVPSAQVKSAIIIAGLQASGDTIVEEPIRSRDHTERLLACMTDGVERDGDRIIVKGKSPLHGTHVAVPGDVSSATFWAVAAVCSPSSEIYLPHVGVNPTRTGALDVLREMGADIEYAAESEQTGEPVGDIIVRSSTLHGVSIGGGMIPRLIDELPVLAVAATQAEGDTTVSGATELRHKESDRIAAICANLLALGADVTEHKDGFTVHGPTPLVGAKVHAHGDHRIAMAMAVAGLLASGKTDIAGSEVASVSYPQFYEDLRRLTI